MLRNKNSRTRGKFSFTRFFQKYQPGDYVAVARELSIPFQYSHRLNGRTGKVIEKRGSCYYVEIADLGKKKRYSLPAIHLKKITNPEAK
ncbi:MAG: hypothetical protein WCK90_04020 [archaeon]